MTKELLQKSSLQKDISFLTIPEAIVSAVKRSNVKVIYNYPGGPATVFVDALKNAGFEIDVQDYLPNEYVATAKGFGSSVAGSERSLVIFKDVGANVACDLFFCLNHVGINRGLVFLIGDDPSAWGSQNEEDSRGIYFNANLPILEPHDQYSAYYSVLLAYELSEIVRLPFFVRTTRKAIKSSFDNGKNDFGNIKILFNENFVDIPFDAKNKWLSIFATVEEDRQELANKLKVLSKIFNSTEINLLKSKGNLGIIASGYPATQLEEENLLDGISLLKLVTVFPLPEEIILSFFKDKERILIVEQGEPLLEILIRDLAQRNKFNNPILGKINGYVQPIGEFREEDLKISVNALRDDKKLVSFPQHSVLAKAGSFDKNADYIKLLDCVREAVMKSGCRPLYCADAGQTSKIPETPGYEDMIHMETTMGCAVSFLSGGIESYKRSKQAIPFKGIAYVGDSDFFHSALPGICEAIAKEHPILMILVNNKGAISTGGQKHLGMKINSDIKELSIRKILESMAVSFLEEAKTSNKKDLTEKILKGINHSGFAVLIVHFE